MMIGRWSDANFCIVLHVVEEAKDGEQKVMSGELFEYPAWYIMRVCWSVSFSMCELLSCVEMIGPLLFVSVSLFVYQLR